MMNRTEVLKTLAEFRTDEIVVFTMTSMTEWPPLSPSSLNFQVSGAMGYASSVGLGLAMACPDRRVIVLDGDGSLLMNLGTLVTISNESPTNLIHCVLENGMYELPGQVPLPASGKLSLCGVARAVGLPKVYEFDNLNDLRERLPNLLHEPGPVFLGLKVALGPREPNKLAVEYDMAREIERALQNSGR